MVLSVDDPTVGMSSTTLTVDYEVKVHVPQVFGIELVVPKRDANYAKDGLCTSNMLFPTTPSSITLTYTLAADGSTATKTGSTIT